MELRGVFLTFLFLVVALLDSRFHGVTGLTHSFAGRGKLRARSTEHVGNTKDERFVELEGGEPAKRNRRAVKKISSTSESATAGGRFYSSSVSYSHLVLPNLSGSEVQDLSEQSTSDSGSGDIRLLRTVIDLPFNFSFFSHSHSQVQMDPEGYLIPHSAGYSPTMGSPNEKVLFNVSHISPLFANWDNETHGMFNNSMRVYSHADYVHFVWEAVLHMRCGAFANKTCPKAPAATFSVTLYANGSMIFNYELLAAKKNYSGATRQFAGLIGLADSSVHDYNTPHDFFVAFRYADIDFSSAFNSTSVPRSITIHPNNITLCSTAIDEQECVRRPRELGCVWCPVHAAYSQKTTPFCTDGKTDRHTVHAVNLGCEHIGTLNSTKVVDHKYYSVLVSSIYVNHDRSTDHLVFKHTSQTSLFRKVHLPFDFPFYGHLVRTMHVSSYGELYPHPDGWCSAYFYCTLYHWFSVSAIQPLFAHWSTLTLPQDSRPGAIFQLNAADNSSVKFVWQNVRRVIRRCTSASCRFYALRQPASFSVTLQRSGAIVFSYSGLSPQRSDYAFSSPPSGRVVLHDSAVAGFDTEFNIVHVPYETLDLSVELLGTGSSVRTILFSPTQNDSCNLAGTNFSSCAERPASMQCLWCVPRSAHDFPMRPTPFCTDSDGREHHVYLVTCKWARPQPTTRPPPPPPPPTGTRRFPTTAKPVHTRPGVATRQPSTPAPIGPQPGVQPTMRSPPAHHHHHTIPPFGFSVSPYPASHGGVVSSASGVDQALTPNTHSPHASALSSGSKAGVAVGVLLACLVVVGIVLAARRGHIQLRLRNNAFVRFTDNDVKLEADFAQPKAIPESPRPANENIYE